MTGWQEALRTGVDGEVKNVDEAYSPHDRNDMDRLRLCAYLEEGKEVLHNLLGPCQQHEGDDGCQSTRDDKGPPLSPLGTTSVALDANVRLYQGAG